MTTEDGSVDPNHDPATPALPPELRAVLVDVLAHELRTPLTAIYGGSHLLQVGMLPADARAALVDDIAIEAERLQGVVEDVLAVERITSGLMTHEAVPVLVHRLAEACAHAEEQRRPGRRIIVDAEAGVPPAYADEEATTHVLRDLLADAARASPDGEPVIIRVTARGDEVRVAIRDHGTRFPDDDGAFRLTPRPAGTPARTSGTGLGLFVARLLVEAQGGRMWLRPRRRGGMEVGFALPRFETDGPGSEPSGPD